MSTLTDNEQIDAMISLIKKASLEEYVALWNEIGKERLNEILSKGLSAVGGIGRRSSLRN